MSMVKERALREGCKPSAMQQPWTTASKGRFV